MNLTLKLILFTVLPITAVFNAKAQETDYTQIKKDIADSLYIQEVEAKKGPIKILHAEPLYIDLIRDLGVRKGEKEWNVGMGLIDKMDFDQYEALIEYEWAPIDRLGLEVEVPFSFYYPVANPEKNKDSIPKNKINSLKLAAQYTFLVSEKMKTSLALGYIQEFELTEFKNYGEEKIIEGNVFNPFFIAAKRWGNNFHTLLYTGPQVFHHFSDNSFHTIWQINSNIHYMISGTRNFIGIEFNKELSHNDFDLTIRPQMRVGITEKLLIGIVAGIPVKRENQRFSTFLRVIYEPGH
ncbi:MAG: phosphoribosylformylglycinamidine synthase [Bacteroidota bacterium]|nr:phosphoribosylformylglycinamidine synthase [Bacteroidota bacterium]